MQKKYTIEDMQEYASDKGGTCMSKHYVDTSSPLKWRCEKGHTWDADFQIIRQGGWCKQCLKASGIKKNTLDKIKEIAISRGGKCLSTEFVSIKDRLDFECGVGHKWNCVPIGIVYYKQWCRKCGYKRNGENAKSTIEEMQKIAIKRGGKCLSLKYVNTNEHLEWECIEGHKWSAAPAMVVSGTWCKICSHKRAGLNSRSTIDEYQKIAIERGGKLLSKTYTGSGIPMLWECSKGHQWRVSGGHVKNSKSWCPECAGYSPLTLQIMIDEAAKHGGECLSKNYINSGTKLKWKCSEGHIWLANPGDVRSGKWCRICGIKSSSDKSRDSIETYHAIAKKRGGKCLSTEYKNQLSKLEFKCSEGHIWKASGLSVKNNGSWCRICGYKSTGLKNLHSIDVYVKLAAKKGGKCLTKIYTGNHKKLEWECKKGHIWKATGTSVQQGGWCRKCFDSRKS